MSHGIQDVTFTPVVLVPETLLEKITDIFNNRKAVNKYLRLSIDALFSNKQFIFLGSISIPVGHLNIIIVFKLINLHID